MLIGALAISIFGSGMWAVAMVYQVIHIGGGPLELSLVAAAGSVGLVAFVLAGGIAADRVPQRLLIIAVEGTNLAVIATVSGLAMAGWLQLWHLVAGAFVLGVGAAFFFPAYSAILPRILPPEDLLAANGMEGTLRPTLQQAAGPAVAGVVVAALSPSHAVTGVAVCHLLAFIVLNFLGQHAPVTASVRLPRRYLTVMMVCWGAGTLPLAAVGLMDSFWLLALALMPVSMALAGPAAAVLPIWLIFLVAGGVCPVVAVVALLVARMSADEVAHPLDRQDTMPAGAEATT